MIYVLDRKNKECLFFERKNFPSPILEITAKSPVDSIGIEIRNFPMKSTWMTPNYNHLIAARAVEKSEVEK